LALLLSHNLRFFLFVPIFPKRGLASLLLMPEVSVSLQVASLLLLLPLLP